MPPASTAEATAGAACQTPQPGWRVVAGCAARLLSVATLWTRPRSGAHYTAHHRPLPTTAQNPRPVAPVDSHRRAAWYIYISTKAYLLTLAQALPSAATIILALYPLVTPWPCSYLALTCSPHREQYWHHPYTLHVIGMALGPVDTVARSWIPRRPLVAYGMGTLDLSCDKRGSTLGSVCGAAGEEGSWHYHNHTPRSRRCSDSRLSSACRCMHA